MSARDQWSSYWTAADTKAACLPDGDGAGPSALDARWADLAAGLPDGAKVVDLACGMGAAGRAMLAAAPHLQMTGVDYADIPNDGADDGADNGTAGFPVLCGIDLVDLPLDDAAYDCAISQYGFEYADEEAAGELVRILKPGGTCRLLIHHRDSAVVRTNAVRSALLSGLIARNVTGLTQKQDPEGLQIVFDYMIGASGEHPLLLEVASACRENLRLPDEARAAACEGLAQGMRRERALLEALAEAAMDRQDIAALQGATASDMDWSEPAIIRAEQDTVSPSGGPILCWELDGQRRSA